MKKSVIIPFSIPATFTQNATKGTPQRPLTIAEAKVKFIEYQRNVKKNSPKTAESYEGEINRFIRWLPKGALTLIEDVTVEDVENYIAYANTEKRKWEDHPFNSNANVAQIGLKGTTVNNMRRYLSCFFNWLVDRGIISNNPVEKIGKVPEEKVGYGYVLEKSEIWRLLQQPDRTSFNGYRDAALIQVLVDTAMRLGQCLALRVDDLLLEQKLIRVRPEITKTNQGRYVAITDGTAYMLNVLVESMKGITSEAFPWLWVTDQGTKLSASTFSKQLKQYAIKAGLDPKRVHPHAFRHFSAIQHYKNGASLEQIQALLDHKDISTTMLYLAKFKHDMREINDKFSPAHDFFKKPGRKSGPRKIQLAAGAEMALSDNIQ